VVKARPQEKEMRFLPQSQAKQFLDAARQTRVYALFLLGVG
jgi:hypothetical protein